MEQKHFINLTNGIEYIPKLESKDYGFVRIQSTHCEQKQWSRLIEEVDYSLLINLAIGNECFVYDYGARKEVSRAIWQGLTFIRTACNYWFYQIDYSRIVVIRGNSEKDCTDYFYREIKSLSEIAKKKLRYCLKFVNQNKKSVQLIGISKSTMMDGNLQFYKEILQKHFN